jgi:hypothetical protein
MNTYEITFDGYTSQVAAETPGKAKYQYYRQYELGDYMEFVDFLKGIESCRLLHRFHPRDLFGRTDQFEYMKQMRGIEFTHIGMRVEVDGRPGTIVGANSSMNLDVCFDGEWWPSNCHPWWMIKYFDNERNLIREYAA